MKLLSDQSSDRVIDELTGSSREIDALDTISPTLSLFAFQDLSRFLRGLGSTRLVLEEGFKGLLGGDLDRPSRNKLNQRFLARELAAWLSRKAEVKATPLPLPQSALICRGENEKALTGSCSLTTGGLGITPGSRFGMVQVSETLQESASIAAWFDSIWSSIPASAEDKAQLLAQLDEISKKRDPYQVYALMLHHLFQGREDEMDEDKIVKSDTGIKETVVWQKLFKFQRDGVIGAIDKLERHGGCIIADSVGLGKTFEALAIIAYYELRNDRVLVLAPKRLRDNWTLYKSNDKRNILAPDRLHYDVLNHTDLSREGGHSGDIDLKNVNWGNYDLVVIDESHNFRNKSSRRGKETRYDQLMKRIIKDGVKTKVLMLSATPVNNRLADLKNQIAFITEGQDDALAQDGIPSIESTVRKAQGQFTRWLKEDESERTSAKLIDMLGFDYFKLLDLLTIARSRKHVEKYYGTAETGEFPTRLKPINYKPDVDLAGEFSSIREINDEIRRLTLAAYAPLRYVLPHKQKDYDEKYSTQVRGGESVFRQADREESLIHLIRVNVLKRMESAVPSFALTVHRQLQDVEATLAKVNSMEQSIEEIDIKELDVDDSLFESLIVGKKVKVLLQDLDLVRWKQDLEEDRNRLASLYSAAKQVTAARDAKLKTLREIITTKVSHPLNGENKKFIIFTAFADTAKYLYRELSGWALSDLGIHSALVTGGGHNKTNLEGLRKDQTSILTAFSPGSKERPADLNDEGEIEILIATDCISEGQNLQDCDFLINYDIHWNPVRIIQRFGRIDRIGSPNDSIQLVNFWPNLELDEYINLEQRVSGRMVLLDISATGEENIIEKESSNRMNDLEYRREQMLQLQDSVIDLEDLSTGVSITDLTLTDYRIDLAEYSRKHPETLELLPLGTFTVTTSLEAEIDPGVIFCLRAEGESAMEPFEPNYPLAPHYLVHVGKDGTTALSFTQAKAILDRLKRLSSGRTIVDSEAYSRLDQETRNGRDMRDMQGLLSGAVASIIGKKEERSAASLFTPGGTQAMKGDFAGINDFEVISYMVVLPDNSDCAVEETEIAVATMLFEKPGNASFSAEEQLLCITEAHQALERFFAESETDDIEINIRHIGDGEGSFWVELLVLGAAAIGYAGGVGNFCHIVGKVLEKWGENYSPHQDQNLIKTGQWFQGLAWRLTPKSGEVLEDSRRPGCFGCKKWLDRRTVRCRDCGFQTDCIEAIRS